MLETHISLDDLENVEYTESRDVYDITVKDEECYYVNAGDKDILVHNSGKSYATVQYIMMLCILPLRSEAQEGDYTIEDALGLDYNLEDKLIISIVRKWLPSMKKSIYRDFLEVIRRYGYYDENNHNKSDLIYTLEGHTVQFFATGNDPERLRSMKHNILYVNEANELTKEEFRQLNMRTDVRVVMDFNPSMDEHWLYDMIDNRPDDVASFHSTYKDNNFIPASQKKEIEELRNSDPEAWKVYGEGKRATLNSGRIYKGWEKISTMPSDVPYFYGLDYGFTSDPTALVKVGRVDNILYVKLLCYKTGMNALDISHILRDNDYYGEPIYCDTNQPVITEELRRMGFDAKKAMKGNFSLVEGIEKLRAMRVFVVEPSDELWKEYNNYSWTLKKGFTPDDKDAWERYPAKNQADHAVDSLRYAYYSHYFKGRGNFFVV